MHDQSVHSGRCFILFVFFVCLFFFVAFLFFIFWEKKYDEIGKNRGYLELGMLLNFGPAEQAENVLSLYNAPYSDFRWLQHEVGTLALLKLYLV